MLFLSQTQQDSVQQCQSLNEKKEKLIDTSTSQTVQISQNVSARMKQLHITATDFLLPHHSTVSNLNESIQQLLLETCDLCKSLTDQKIKDEPKEGSKTVLDEIQFPQHYSPEFILSYIQNLKQKSMLE